MTTDDARAAAWEQYPGWVNGTVPFPDGLEESRDLAREAFVAGWVAAGRWWTATAYEPCVTDADGRCIRNHYAETTTATVEDAARVIEEATARARRHLNPGATAQALADSGLLATAPTATVEDAYRMAYDVMRHHPGIWHNSLRAAIEALADSGLLATARTRPTEAEAGARALLDFADATRFPSDWILFRRDDGSGVTVGDLLRETAARLRGGDHRG